MNKTRISFEVNGQPCTVNAYPARRLLDVLREDLRLTGTKEGCGEGECGACSVLVDGELVNSCLLPVMQASGARICTIEGISNGPDLGVLQRAFAEAGGAQCGICTPGMIIASTYLLSQNQNPTREQISEALSGNLCRCTGYQKIVDAVYNASRQEHESLHPGL